MKLKSIAVTVFIAIVAIIGIVNIFGGNSMDKQYEEALALLEDGKKEEAYEIFTEIKRHKDSVDLASEIFAETKLGDLTAATVGDIIIFGTYEQDNDLNNGSEPIEWIILDKIEDGQTNRILVLSKYALDCVIFDDTLTTDDITWQESYMRRWLNRTFLPTAFDAVEERLVESVLLTDKKGNPYDKEDRVFLLSYEEFENYLFTQPQIRKCEATAYTKAMGAYTSKEDIEQEYETCYWWLRTVGHNFRSMVCVSDTGSYGYSGYLVTDEKRAVRPAIWLDLKAFE